MVLTGAGKKKTSASQQASQADNSTEIPANATGLKDSENDADTTSKSPNNAHDRGNNEHEAADSSDDDDDDAEGSDADDGDWQDTGPETTSEDSQQDEDDQSEGDESEDDASRQISEAILDYVGAVEGNSANRKNENGSLPRDHIGGGDPENEETGSIRPTVESDSSEDEMPSRNTIGDVPLEWYKNEEHIGYDLSGRKIKKKERRDQLDSYLARSDDAKDWRKIYDEYNDEEIELTKDEIDLIKRLREGKLPHAQVNPYEPYVDWFNWEDKGHPLSSAPEPKRRFIPSKWEAKKVVKLVRAIRKGWIKLDKPKEKPKYYLMWGDDLRTVEKTANGLAYIPAPKPKLPGHEESYNPSIEYIPTEEERNSYALMYEEDRPKFIPKGFESLRQVPSYSEFVKECFERCLDLYLCPRTRKKRININPESLIPKLPKAKDLQPFPAHCYLEYHGHTGPVLTISVEPAGMWLASGSSDGTVRLWEVQTGRCSRVWNMGRPVNHISWNPQLELYILAVAVDKEVVLLDTKVGGPSENITRLLTINMQLAVADAPGDGLVRWFQHETLQALQVKHNQDVLSVSWHHKGDYFVSVAPNANTRAVLVHQLSKQQTQNPFRKLQGRVISVRFHPFRPFLFVATKMHIRVYNLAKQQLSKKLLTGLHEITSMAIHPKGDNMIIGSQEGKLCWFDMDLSTKPYKTLKNHREDIQAVAYHMTYPLFASCSHDSTIHVFHGMVYSDLLQNPLIVPLKILHGHQKVDGRGVLDCQFHVKQPWLFTAGADAVIKLFSN